MLRTGQVLFFLMLICILKIVKWICCHSCNHSSANVGTTHHSKPCEGGTEHCQPGPCAVLCLEAVSPIELSSGKNIIGQVSLYVRGGGNSFDSWLKGQDTTWNETQRFRLKYYLSAKIRYDHSQDVSLPGESSKAGSPRPSWSFPPSPPKGCATSKTTGENPSSFPSISF